MPTPEDAYRLDGYTHLPDLLDPSEAHAIATVLARLSGLATDDCASVLTGQREPFYQHGGVAAHPDLWPLLTHPGITKAVAAVLQDAPKCLPGIDTIGMHIAETDPHRDASPEELPALGDKPYDTDYPVVRVILYPTSPGARFGLLPGSHRQPGSCADLTANNPDAWRWVTISGGDALLFDPRLVHAGAALSNPKPMIILTYGIDGPHALQTYFHARIKTAQLGFTDPRPDLAHHLEDAQLLLSGIQDQANWRTFASVWGHD
ncbi:MAG: hypothetical protein ACRDQ7_02465 [Haloechinothrix sp.]